MKNIKFKKIDNNFNNFELLFKWCQNEFVYEWFEQRKLNMDEIINKYSNKIKENKQKMFIVYENNIPFAYFQYYKSDYNNSYEYDIFIGEEKYLSKGYGTILINKINNYIFENEKCNSIILRPFSRNIRAIRTYKKCGFKIIDEYLGKDSLGKDEVITIMLKKEV